MKRFLAAMNQLATLAQVEVGPFVFMAYERALSRFGEDRLMQAAEKILLERRPGAKHFPTVQEFLEAMGESPMSDEQKAMDVANRIWGTICTKGSSAKQEDLLERIGEVGVYLAKIHGGWTRLCAETDNLKEPTFWRQQLAREAAVYMEKARRGTLELPPAFDDEARRLPETQKMLESLGVDVSKMGNAKTSAPKDIQALADPRGTTPSGRPPVA